MGRQMVVFDIDLCCSSMLKVQVHAEIWLEKEEEEAVCVVVEKADFY